MCARVCVRECVCVCMCVYVCVCGYMHVCVSVSVNQPVKLAEFLTSVYDVRGEVKRILA